MVNSTDFPFFILSAYVDLGRLKYFCFTAVLLLYIVIVAANVFLIVLICIKRSLHEPMYVFLCSLLVNELYGSAGLFPFLLQQILSDTHIVSTSACFLQIYCLYTYAQIEFCNLAAMSYDRYLAICCPLHYNTRMTANKVALYIMVVWLYSLSKFLISLVLSVHLLLCGNVMNTLYCNNYYVVRLACSDTTVNNVYGIFTTILSVVVPLVLILFSYIRILRICLVGSRETRQKAVSTCSPHLASLINFSFGCCFQIFHSRFDVSSVPGSLRIFLSLYFLMCQPLFNPVMYGFRMSKIRAICKGLFSSN